MRIGFMGTPEFASASLDALLASHHQVVAVISQPDRPSGRGRKLVSPPVATLALSRDLSLLQPDSIKTKAVRDWIAGFAPDAIVVAAYGGILGPKMLALPPLGCINVHASLLPRWRGASPIQAAIAAGDAESGVTIMQMDEGLDTGAMLDSVRIPLSSAETGDTLHDKLAAEGGPLLVRVLDGLEADRLKPVAQDAKLATYAHMLSKKDGDIDWRMPALTLARRIRAYYPWPGCRTRHFRSDAIEDASLKILPPVSVSESPSSGAPGTVTQVSSECIEVACGDGFALKLHRLQAPGRKALEAASFLGGYSLVAGDTFR